MATKKLKEEIINQALTLDFPLLKEYVTYDNINCMDRDGRSLLFHAVLSNNLNLVKWLIEKGANVNLMDKNGWTPLHFAAQGYSFEILVLLISSGANVNAQDKYGNTVLSRATYSSLGRGEIILELIRKGADPTIKNNYDISALDLAKTIANYDVLKFF